MQKAKAKPIYYLLLSLKPLAFLEINCLINPPEAGVKGRTALSAPAGLFSQLDCDKTLGNPWLPSPGLSWLFPALENPFSVLAPGKAPLATGHQQTPSSPRPFAHNQFFFFLTTTNILPNIYPILNGNSYFYSLSPFTWLELRVIWR